MKDFFSVSFNPHQCRREIEDFDRFLKSASALAERSQIQPFFRARPQLTAFVGTQAPEVGPGTLVAYEFPIFGDFAADIIVGNRENRAYCIIEFEDSGSVFTKTKGKSTSEWSKRFEHGFSQLVDWFHALDDLKSTTKYEQLFGHGHVKFEGMLVVGKESDLTEADRNRLRCDQTRCVSIPSASIVRHLMGCNSNSRGASAIILRRRRSSKSAAAWDHPSCPSSA